MFPLQFILYNIVPYSTLLYLHYLNFRPQSNFESSDTPVNQTDEMLNVPDKPSPENRISDESHRTEVVQCQFVQNSDELTERSSRRHNRQSAEIKDSVNSSLVDPTKPLAVMPNTVVGIKQSSSQMRLLDDQSFMLPAQSQNTNRMSCPS